MPSRHWKNPTERHAFFLSKKVDKAVRAFDMICDGDRVLVGVSGGKDSLVLLELLAYRQQYSPARYELFAAHVRGDARGSGTPMPATLGEWLDSKRIQWVSADLVVPEGEPLPMGCERCGRNRRRTLFELAESLGCNRVALGHSLEDFAHTALMNLFRSGSLETMAFRRDYFGGRFSVIRPLAYLREHEIARFAQSAELPATASECPLASASRRAAARQLLHGISREFRSAAINIVRGANPDLGDELE